MGFAGVGKNQDWVMAGKDTAVTVADSLGLDSSKIHDMFARVVKTAREQERTKPTDKTMVAQQHNARRQRTTSLQARRLPVRSLRSTAQDLVLLLHLSTSSEFRAKFEPEIVRFYHSTFSDTIEKNNRSIEVRMSIEEMREEILKQKLRAVVTAALYSPAVFANGKFAEDLIADPDEFEKFQYVDRRENVFELMRRNEMYRSRIEDAVRELVDYGERFFMIE
ncbi:uncharacterized protein LOC116738502 [Nasonia vitripennis]|uniref:Uncharacterized protein n=1 Tax=Nasonia vitripennis TaxID=7425 RepID=A0A7M7TC55_NASVI|nr:uncharacterized protein LOC116738502 [Nasonia vitripennis]